MSLRPFNKLSIGKNAKTMYYDTIVLDRFSSQLVFVSLVDSSNDLKLAQVEVNRINSIYINEANMYVSTNGAKYDTDFRKQNNSDFAHLIINKKDIVENLENGNDILISYIYSRNNDELLSKTYDKLYSNTAVPLLEDWMPYIIEEMIKAKFLRPMLVYSSHEQAPFSSHRLIISKEQLLKIVQQGLRDNSIGIKDVTTNSELMEFIDGLDSYLNIFGDTLAKRIQESFIPKFDPQKQDYSEYVDFYDDSCYHKGLDIYNAQKATIQAAVNNLDVNNVTYVIGEMGSGI